jgi:hypothetical protein
MKHFLHALLSTALMILMPSTNAFAHELQANRASLVLRDSQHLSLTFFVDYVGVLHQVLAPQRTLQEFVLMYASMKPLELQSQLLAAQKTTLPLCWKTAKPLR